MCSGMTRLNLMLDDARKSNPTAVVMNIGDIFHAGVSLLLAVNTMDDLLNAPGIDVGVIGSGGSYFSPVIPRARYRAIVGLEGDVAEALPCIRAAEVSTFLRVGALKWGSAAT